MKDVYSVNQAVRIAGISYRQAQYWDKSDFIKPSRKTQGNYRLYTFYDIFVMKSARIMRDYEFSIQMLRKIVNDLKVLLRQITCPLDKVNLLVRRGTGKIILFNGDVVTNDLKNYVFISGKAIAEEADKLFPVRQPAASQTTA